jgi:hypothetical protein
VGFRVRGIKLSAVADILLGELDAAGIVPVDLED